jgi:hypothetical protein
MHTDLLRDVPCFCTKFKNFLCMTINSMACIGGRNSLDAARQQTNPDTFLQTGHLLTQRRLRYMQRSRRARQGPSIDDLNKVTKLSEIKH